MRPCFVAAVLLGPGACFAAAQWEAQAFNSKADLRGLCVVSPAVAWVGGTKGTFGRTIDAGKTWSVGTVPGAETLDFRAVKAFDENRACLLSAGPGAESRIYQTTVGGKTWALRFTNDEPAAFYDALAFGDEKHGLALSDPVRGRFRLLATDDGGQRWRPLPDAHMPDALPGEGAFAASGTCLMAHGSNDVWFGAGGAKTARVFHSRDRGRRWTVAATPVAAGVASAGVFSIAFRDAKHGMIVGGDYRKPEDATATGAATHDGGKTWTPLGTPLPFRSCVGWAKDRWVAVGTSGSDFSADDGATWQPLDKQNYNAVGFDPTGEGWAVGPNGRVAKFRRAAAANHIRP